MAAPLLTTKLYIPRPRPQGHAVSRPRLLERLDEGLRLGALGVGSTIGYAREGITTYEMLEAQRIAGRYGRLTSVHHRFHPSAATPTETQTGVNEVLVNAMTLKAPLELELAEGMTDAPPAGLWQVPDRLNELALPTLMKKLLRHAGKM